MLWGDVYLEEGFFGFTEPSRFLLVAGLGTYFLVGAVFAMLYGHIRAVAGWPLGPTTAHARIEMTNLLGDEIDQWRKLSGKSDERLHLYGKAQARPGRKMAHVNRVLGAV